MTGEQFSWVGTVFGILPFAFALVFFLLYLARKRWIEGIFENLKSIRVSLRNLQMAFEKYRLEAQGFSVDDPDEYGELAAAYQQQLIVVEVDMRNFYKHYGQLQEESRVMIQTKTWYGIFVTLGGIYQLFQEVRYFENEVLQYGSKFSKLDEAKERLVKYSWEVAQNAQKLLGKIQIILEKNNLLSNQGANGDQFTRLRAKNAEWQSTLLKQIPVIFFSPDPELVKMQAQKDETVRVHKINQLAQSEIETLFITVDSWINLKESRERLISEISNRLTLIEIFIKELENRPIQPIVFTKAKQKLIQFQRIQNFGLQENYQNPENFAAQVKELELELNQVHEFNASLVELKKIHDDYLTLWQSKEIQSEPEFLRTAYQKILEIEQYNLLNYSQIDKVSELRIDTDRLAILHAKFTRFAKSSSISEEDLASQFQVLSNLVALLNPLMDRFSNSYKRYKALDKTQKECLVLLTQMGQWCSDLLAVSEDNNLLSKVASSDLKKISNQINQIVQELTNLKSDLIEKKANRIDKLADRFCQLTDRWGELLLNDLRTQETLVSNQVQELRDIVWIDDPIVDATEKLIKTTLALNQAQGNGRIPLESSISQLLQLHTAWKQRNEVYQHFREYSNPVLSEYGAVSKSRQETVNLFHKVTQILPENDEAWPPTSQRLNFERSTFKNLELKWDSLRRERMRLEKYLEQIASLAEQYNLLRKTLSEIFERVVQDQARFSELERRLDESKKMWQTVGRNFKDRGGVTDGVNLLLSNLDKDVSVLKSQYQRGEVNAQFAYQRFRAICRKTDETVVDLDSGQLIDINGTIQNRI